MGLMDKLKNIFFEEDEEDEIEEPIAPKKEKKVEKKKEIEEKEYKKEKTKNVIAKKIELPKQSREKEEKEKIEETKEVEEKVIEQPKEEKVEKVIEKKVEVKPKRETRINTELIFDDEDFNIDTKPKVVKEKTRSVENKETNLYRSREVKNLEIKPNVDVKVDYSKKISTNTSNVSTTAYAKKEEVKAKTFTPSPIISPIYGILDKNYKKEEVKENKEIRISSRPSRMDLDSVRNKAFGDLEYDLMNEFKDTEEKNEKKSLKDKGETEKKTKNDIKKMYSSNQEDDKPTIERVTLAEADEYYNDLGLAYNTDYKDLSKDMNDGKVREKEEKSEDKLEDNLFDLIESMYDKEE